jgi:hypothetical protein
VLEALLYFQGAIHSEVWNRDYPLRALWDRLTAARCDLIDEAEEHGQELALIFDAVAWSRPPLVESELLAWLAPIFRALEQDESLNGAMALTCLYHPEGPKLLKGLGLDSPLAYISNLNKEQMAKAAEMIRWHFVHQSRGRALFTRRRLEPANPQLLQRTGDEKRVSKSQAEAIEKFVKRMARFPGLRGWAIHLAFNLWCTAGEFDDGFLARLISEAKDGDLGMVTAALTYQIPGGARDQMQRYFRSQPNRELLLSVMLEGCEVETLAAQAAADVCPPRFIAGRVPCVVHRELQTEWKGRLEKIPNLHEPEFLHEVHETLEEAERKGYVDADSMWDLLHRVQRGDLRPLDVARVRDYADNRSLRQWLTRRGELAEIVVSVCLDMTPDTLI